MSNLNQLFSKIQSSAEITQGSTDLNDLVKNLYSNKPSTITFVNNYSAEILSQPNSKHILNKINYIFTDGIIYSKIASFFLRKEIPRISFDTTSIAGPLFEYSVRHNKTIFLVGGKPGFSEMARENILRQHPKLKISSRHGYFSSANEKIALIKHILDNNFDFVISGMGTPLQEQFLIDLVNDGWDGIGFTCGGYIEQSSYGYNYYPGLINKYNLRWLYRIYKEPRRLLLRYLIDYPSHFFKIFTNLK